MALVKPISELELIEGRNEEFKIWKSFAPNIKPTELQKALSLPGMTTEGTVMIIENYSAEIDARFLSSGSRRKVIDFKFILFNPFERNDLRNIYVQPEYQGNDLTKQLLRNVVGLSQKQGNDIRLNATQVGSYAWAKFGFLPKPKMWNGLLKHQIKDRLNNYQPQLMKTDEGRDAFEMADSLLFHPNPDISGSPAICWLISDLVPEVTPEKSFSFPDSNPVTIGKALLIDLAWSGLFLTMAGSPCMERFNAYIGQALEKSKK